MRRGTSCPNGPLVLSHPPPTSRDPKRRHCISFGGEIFHRTPPQNAANEQPDLPPLGELVIICEPSVRCDGRWRQRQRRLQSARKTVLRLDDACTPNQSWYFSALFS